MPSSTVDVAINASPEATARMVALSTTGIAGCTLTPLSPLSLIVSQSTMPVTVLFLTSVGTLAAVVTMCVFYSRTLRAGRPIDPSWLAVELLLVVLVVLMWLAVAVVRYSYAYVIDVVADGGGSVLHGVGAGADWEGHFERVVTFCEDYVALPK